MICGTIEIYIHNYRNSGIVTSAAFQVHTMLNLNLNLTVH